MSSKQINNAKKIVSTLVNTIQAEAKASGLKGKAKNGKGKGKGKGKKGKANGNSNGRQPHGVSLFGSKGNVVSNTTSMPIAFDTLEGNICYAKVVGGVKHPKEGLDGIRIIGCQPFATIGTAGADTNILINTTLASGSANNIVIGPDDLNGPLAAQANLHARFVFTDIVIEYISTVATSQANAVCFNLDSDVVTGNAATDFSTCRQVSPSITIPFRHDRAYLHVHYDGDQLFYTESDNASLAGLRQTHQYLFNAWPNAAAGGAITYGYTNIYYICDLYQSVQSRGFTARVNPRESALLMEYLQKIRTEMSTQTSSSTPSHVINNQEYIMVPKRAI